MALDAAYREAGLAILAFPSDQFGGQEAATNAEVKDFVAKYDVAFNMMERVDVNGPDAAPVFHLLREGGKAADVTWNFGTKWLVSKDGATAHRFDGVDPMDMEADIVEMLGGIDAIAGEGKL